MTDVDIVETPAGPCAVAVRDGRIVELRLGRSIGMVARRRRLPQVRRWIAQWFAGRSPRVPLEFQAAPFVRRVYELVRRIPTGRTRT